MRVNDVLTSKGSDEVFTISPDASVSQLLDVLAELNIGALVVRRDDDDAIAGIVSERDIVRKLRGVEDPRTATVATIMSEQIQVCSPETPLAELTATMTEYRVRHVPVVDDGRLVGLVSIGDAVKYRMDQLQFERDQLEQYVQG
ncbi:CBS domain-containing protein [Aeromicrobium sp. YIM 150415]|uniref:CBS domain-containing protein n=1 Tax=Aeromicrobium piscarium TaxID=2590901 RepID=A0A554SH11_9ACTN|nr:MULTISPECIES: CBS domain-containing protein [Aeromicrobium]MBM9462995.1 CBS domain-containing protein [Aeromicrobium sp. YIM 150415]TSD65631.1 CBS domain-containing protein [Aeromicrobium piscarium]